MIGERRRLSRRLFWKFRVLFTFRDRVITSQVGKQRIYRDAEYVHIAFVNMSRRSCIYASVCVCVTADVNASEYPELTRRQEQDIRKPGRHGTPGSRLLFMHYIFLCMSNHLYRIEISDSVQIPRVSICISNDACTAT